MRIEPTSHPDVIVFASDVHDDARGFVLESWRRGQLPADLDQVNLAGSHGGTLRGLHYQLSPPQGKLVRCVTGEIFDVALDLRRGSPRFGQWAAVTLREGDGRAVWIPPGFAHGFYAVATWNLVLYMMSGPRDVASERVIRWDSAGITWPASPTILSTRDREGVEMGEDVGLE